MQSFAIMGSPVDHSQSPFIHKSFAKLFNIDMDYRKIQSALGEFRQDVESFFASGGKGLNITLPFKEEAYNLCHTPSERAKRAGAVNTLWQAADGSFCGDTTDGIGLIRDIRDNLDFSLHGKNLLILGAGGSSRGILYALLEEQPHSLTITNRTRAKAEALAFGNPIIRVYDYHELPGHSFDVVINATSSSLQGKRLPIPDELFSAGSLAYDMAYGCGLTPFLSQAQQQKAAILADGIGMLVEQAAESFYLWHNVRPATRLVLNELRDLLP